MKKARSSKVCKRPELVKQLYAEYPIQVDEWIVAAVRRERRPLLFEPTLKRRAASMVCTSFPLAHFHQIKTNPEAPKIRKANLRIQRVLDEVAIALVFDPSGSMASGKREIVAQQSAVIFCKALCFAVLPKLKSIYSDLTICLL